MRRNVARFVVSLLMTMIAGTLLAGPVYAQTPARAKLELAVPPEGAIGQPMTVVARLTLQAGTGIEGAEIVFSRDSRFMNASSELELGRASTNELGSATLSFMPRSEGDMLILADFAGDGRYGPAFADGTVAVKTGPALYSEQAGVRVPGINVYLLVAIVGGVWCTYFAVMARVWFIAREGAAIPSVSEVSGE